VTLRAVRAVRPVVDRSVGRALGLATSAGTAARVLGGSGVIRPLPPATLGRIGKALRDRGTGPAGGFTAMALRDPDRVGLVDERGSLTFAGPWPTAASARATAWP
jgi:hypothetical protein